MSLRLKIILILIAGSVAIFAADRLVEDNVVLPQFAKLDQQRTERNLDRVQNAIAAEVEHLRQNAKDYGQWDAAYEFLQGRQPDFLRSNLSVSALVSLNVDLIAFVDLSGKYVAGQSADLDNAKSIGAEEIFEKINRLPNDRRDAAAMSGRAGVMVFGNDLLLAACSPVVASQGDQPAGHILLAHVLTPADLERIQRQTDVCFVLLRLDARSFSAEDWKPLPWNRRVFSKEKPDVMLARGSLKDIQGQPVRVIQVDVPREISLEGQAAMASEEMWTLATIAVLLLLAYVVFGIFVIRPIRRLAKSINWIRQCGDLTKRVGIRSRDEVGELAGDFDLLLAQLHRARAARLRAENRLNEIIRQQRETIRDLTEQVGPAASHRP